MFILQNTDGRVPFLPVLHLVLPEVALVVLVALKLPLPLKFAASGFLLSGIIYVLTCTTTGNVRDDYAVGSAVLGNTFFNVILFVWLTDPMKDFRYIRGEDRSPLLSRPLFSRLYNSACIVRNNRLIGWNVQVANVPPPCTTRSQFFRRRILQLLWSIFLTDLTEAFIYPNRALYDTVFDAPGLTGHAMRSWCMFVWLVMTYAILKMSYELGSLIIVALGLSRPEDWPDTFGLWEDAYTLRRLWGRTWHQNLRRHFSYWGKFVVRVFGVPRGTWISSQVQLYTAFALSALIHASGDLMVLGGTRVLDGSMPFFAANAFAISIEDALLAAARRVLGKKDGERVTRGMRVLGYVWVIGWMSVLAPMYVRWMFEVGVVMAPVLPFGPLQTIVVPWLRQTLQ